MGGFPERRFQNQMSEQYFRKKTSLLDRFKSLPAGVLMRSGAAMGGVADDLVSGLAASGKVLGNYFDTQTPEAQASSSMIEMYKDLMDAESKKALAQNRASKVSKH